MCVSVSTLTASCLPMRETGGITTRNYYVNLHVALLRRQPPLQSYVLYPDSEFCRRSPLASRPERPTSKSTTGFNISFGCQSPHSLFRVRKSLYTHKKRGQAHGDYPMHPTSYLDAPCRQPKSANSMLSTRALRLASTMFSWTPTVPHSLSPSVEVIRTRVFAALPPTPPRIRTL